jgi:DNA processing protein
MDLHLPILLERDPDLVVVSGGARGIDQKAHAMSLRSKSSTVAILPSGIGNPYPGEFRNWFDKIIDSGGAILSSLEPSAPVRKQYFESRNRLIVALAKLVFVVEARRKSGSIMTARLARELGRTVALLPAFPGEIKSDGCVDLLFDGGFPVRDADDVFILQQLMSAK